MRQPSSTGREILPQVRQRAGDATACADVSALRQPAAPRCALLRGVRLRVHARADANYSAAASTTSAAHHSITRAAARTICASADSRSTHRSERRLSFATRARRGRALFLLALRARRIGCYDITHPAPTPTALVVGPPGPAATLAPISTTPEVRIQIDSIGRFGLATTSGKLLTYSDDGDTNNTRVQVDGVDAIVGEDDGTFTTRPQIRGAGMIMGWSWRGIETTQEVALTAGATTRRTDTIRVRYTLTNRSPQTHQVALRVMLDTLIGGNDGVPFLLAGENAITTRAKDLRGAAVPDFIQALEREDIRNPGTMVNLALRGGDATPPDRLVLAHWPGSDAEWEYLEDEGGVGAGWGKDSSAGLYYNAKPLAPNESRVIVFYYGLGGIAAVGKVGMTVPLEVVETEKFSVIVVVMNPREGQRVTLTLPSALAFADGDTASKNVTPVPGAAYTQVSWKLRAASPADAVRLSARLDPEGDTTTQTIRIQPCGVTRPCSTAP